jgi:hypothetical protein
MFVVTIVVEKNRARESAKNSIASLGKNATRG